MTFCDTFLLYSTLCLYGGDGLVLLSCSLHPSLLDISNRLAASSFRILVASHSRLLMWFTYFFLSPFLLFGRGVRIAPRHCSLR